ncbi:uncharacterized protein LOC142334782 isoform X1 [Convolutriloba macropyga]|uniref:uncharacterized protein LOC142334782 isoform X1 n=1 Tax=Convolutriloba macropyga TaxID=536237 RepID=UPI003F528158
MSARSLREPSLIVISFNLLGLSTCFFTHGASHFLSRHFGGSSDNLTHQNESENSLEIDAEDKFVVITGNASISFIGYLVSWSWLVCYFIFGLCVFSLYEWVVHFFIYHGWRVHLVGMGWQLHMRHHHYPEKLLHVPHSLAQHYLWVCLFILANRLSLPWVASDVIVVIVAGNLLGLYLHEVAHLHAHGHAFLNRRLKFLQPCRRYHSYHHYSSESCKVAFGLVTPWVDYLTGYLPPHPSASPFHVHYSPKEHNWSFLSFITRHLMRTPVPVPFLHWICMYSLSQEGDF